MSRRNVLARGAVIGLAAPGVAILGRSGTSARQDDGSDQTLTIAHNVDPATFNPYLTTAAAEESAILPIVEKLAVFDGETMDVLPWLAESWEYLDPTTIQLKLRPGVTFSNGEPLNAAAAKWGFEEWMAQPVMAQASASLKGSTFEAVDETTLVIRTAKPVPSFPTIIGRYGYMLPPAYYAEVGAEGFSSAPIGTGPFVLDRHEPDSQIVYTRNPNYWRGPHTFQTVVFRIMPEEVSRAAAAETGEVDIAYYLSHSMVKRLETTDNVTVHTTPGLRKFIAGFNAEMEGGDPLLDPRVRVALNQAVDVDGIIEFVYEGQAEKLNGQYALPAEFGYNDQVPAYTFDPEAAKKLIADAGYPEGFKITYAYTLGRYPKDREVGEIIATYLQEIGLEVEQKPLEWGEFDSQRTERTLGQVFQVGLLHAPDLEYSFTYMAFGKEARGAPLLTWSEEWWELYNQSMVEVDPDKRLALYHRMLEIDHEEPFGIYLFAPYDYYATTNRITGFVARKDQFIFLYDVGLATDA
jgi:peptide/nickel transport system substrate-binding protein